MPKVDASARIHAAALVIGHVCIGKRVLVEPFTSVRGDEGQPLFIGDETNVQDGVVIHALQTEHSGFPVEKKIVEVDGERYAAYIGKEGFLGSSGSDSWPLIYALKDLNKEVVHGNSKLAEG